MLVRYSAPLVDAFVSVADRIEEEHQGVMVTGETIEEEEEEQEEEGQDVFEVKIEAEKKPLYTMDAATGVDEDEILRALKAAEMLGMLKPKMPA